MRARLEWTMKKNNLFLVCVLLALAVIFRVQYWIKYDYLFGSDPYTHYSILRQMVEQGPQINNYTLTNFPNGVEVHHPQGFYYLVYFPYLFLRLFKVDLFWTIRIVSLLAGLSHVFLIYLIGKKIFSKKVGVLSASFLAINLSHIYKTSNHYRGEMFFLSFFLFGIYLLLSKNKKKRFIAFLSLGLSVWVWNGYTLILILLPIMLFFKHAYKRFSTVRILLTLFVFLLMCLIFWNKVLYILTGGGLIIPVETFFSTISELQRTDLFFLWANIGLVMFFAMFGFVVCFFCGFNEKKAFILPWIIMSLFFMFSSRRFVFLASPGLCLLSGAFLAWVYNHLENHLGSRRVASCIIWLVMFLAGMTSILFSVHKPMVTDRYVEALLFLKENSPENATVFGWWDRLAPVEAFARRSTYLDSVYQIFPRWRWGAEFFLTDKPLPKPIADYIIVDENLIYNVEAMASLLKPGQREELITQPSGWLMKSNLFKLLSADVSNISTPVKLVFDNRFTKIYQVNESFSYTEPFYNPRA